MFIKIPTPLGGYVNCGDAVVLLGAFLLGPLWGALAAGIGSALADVISGYVIYAPGTFIIKAAMAVVAALLLAKLRARQEVSASICAVIAEIIMVLGYFVYEALPLGFGVAAAANIPFNGIQGVFGAVASVLLYLALSKVPYVRTLAKG
jgi:uncharacterized membrane protein